MPLGERCSSREITLSNECEWETATCWLTDDGECKGNALCSGKNETTCEETQYGYCSPRIGSRSEDSRICSLLQNEAACEGEEAWDFTVACKLNTFDQGEQPDCWRGAHTNSLGTHAH